MAGERRYTRIPPESTGDRIYMVHSARIPYTGKDSAYNWEIGGFYTVDDGNTNTVTLHVHGVWEDTPTSGYIEVHYDKDTKNRTERQPGNTQAIIDSGGTTRATVTGTIEDIYINTNHIMGYDNPEYGLDVDRFGSANVRFSEGPPEVSAFGKLRITEPTLIAQYEFSKSELNDQFVNSQEGKGVKTWNAERGAVELTVSGDPTTNDRVTNTSNLFHPYIPGSGIFYQFAARSAGNHIGVVRNWGPFDSTDGYFFQTFGTGSDGTSPNLRVVHRYSLGGAGTINEAIPQADWNVDTLNGTGGGDNPSGMNLDISKINNYWVDYQYIGGGRTRWGVFFEGERIVCHEEYHANGDSAAPSEDNPLGNPNRPICWAIANRAAAGTPDDTSAKIFAYGASVYLESDSNPLEESVPRRYSNTNVIIPSGSTSTTYGFTLSPQLNLPESRYAQQNGATLASGQLENHSIYKPELLQVTAYNDDDDTVDTKVEVRLFQKCIIRGANYSNVNFTTVSADRDADHLAHGPEIARFTIDGQGEFNFDNIFTTIQNGAISNGADQAFARQSQLLQSFSQSADPEGTGVNRVMVTVKDHPTYGPESDIHFFDDKNQVILRNPAYGMGQGPEDLTGFSNIGSLKTTEGDFYYLSLIDRNDAWLYVSSSFIDNDRIARVLNVDTTGSAVVGEKIYVVPEMTASILELGTGTIRLEGRSTASLDNTLGATTWTSDGDAVGGNVTSVTTGSITNYPLDYKTSLLALSQADAGFTLSSGTSFEGNALYGNPPPAAAWTFMVRVLNEKAYDVRTRWNMTWKERIQ